MFSFNFFILIFYEKNVCVYRLSEKKEQRNPEQNYFVDMINEIPENRNKIETLKTKVPELAECFQFYQDLRGYVTDLVECLDEKVGVFSNVLVVLFNNRQLLSKLLESFTLSTCLL